MDKIKSFVRMTVALVLAAFILFLVGKQFVPKPLKVEGVSHFGRTFNDLQDRQIEAAKAYGIEPLENRDDAERVSKRRLVRLENNKYYVIDKLDYSIPYLTKEASECLDGIAMAFRDSLKAKHYPKCQLVVTSVLRTKEDVNKLRRKNRNATSNSCHMYGTTFDISWKTFHSEKKRMPDEDVMKLILSEVLRDQREDDLCYVKYEKSEGCFHITSRIPSRGRRGRR